MTNDLAFFTQICKNFGRMLSTSQRERENCIQTNKL